MAFKQLGLGKDISKPGLSCKDIADRQVYPQGDGEYWIAPDGSNNSFIAYCDMTTDGGKRVFVSYDFRLQYQIRKRVNVLLSY